MRRRRQGGWTLIEIAKLTLLSFAILVAGGGVIGFVAAKSKVSLSAGLISGLLLLGCFFYSQYNARIAFSLGNVLCLFLFAIFVVRLARGAKFMPAGLMLILTAVAFAIMGLAMSRLPNN